MCGRFSQTRDPAELEERFGVSLAGVPAWTPRFNLAPSQAMLAVRDRGAGREPALLRFGLIPHWARSRSVGYKMTNAKAETVLERPAYRTLVAGKRCLILADGFYEWRRGADGRKQPVRFTLADGGPFAFAGLWSAWRDPEADELVESAAIITTAANQLVSRVHNRMPAIVAPDAEQAWLDPTVDARQSVSLLLPYPEAQMTMRLCSPLLNDAKYDHAGLLLAEGEQATDENVAA